MKRLFLIICTGFLFLYPLSSLELELSGGVNYLTYHPKRVTPHRSGSSEATRLFQAYPFFIANASLSNEISSSLGFNVNFTRDNILRNILDGKFTAKTDFFNLEFGPFIGMNDKREIPHYGLSGKIDFIYPGVIFLSLSGSSTVGSSFNFTNDNSLEYGEAKLGFWLPYVIPSFSAGIKRFAWQEDDTLKIRDTLSRFVFNADFYGKNFPLTFRFDAGYEILSRSYTKSTEITDKLYAFFLGFELTWQVSNPIKLKAGFEMPVYRNAEKPMTSPELWRMPKATAGIVYTFY